MKCLKQQFGDILSWMLTSDSKLYSPETKTTKSDKTCNGVWY